MTRAVIAVAACVIVAGAAGAQKNCKEPDPKAPWLVAQRASFKETTWSNDSLRRGLMSDAYFNGKLEPNYGAEVHGHDQVAARGEGMAYLKRVAAVRGSPWPNRSAVGAAGVRAVYLLALRDTALLRVALHRMMEGGPDEALKSDVAVMEDYLRLRAGRKQLYGTHMALVNGRFTPLAIEDSAHVDLRREAADLPPLAWSVCNVNAR